MIDFRAVLTPRARTTKVDAGQSSAIRSPRSGPRRRSYRMLRTNMLAVPCESQESDLRLS